MFVALRHRWIALVSMALLGVIALNLVRNQLAIDEAATRALILVVVAACVDRYVMPIVLLAVGIEQRAPALSGKKAKKAKTDDDADDTDADDAD